MLLEEYVSPMLTRSEGYQDIVLVEEVVRDPE
jgi:hypothetical protein